MKRPRAKHFDLRQNLFNACVKVELDWQPPEKDRGYTVVEYTPEPWPAFDLSVKHDKTPLDAVGGELGVSGVRIRQIERRALEKLRKALKKQWRLSYEAQDLETAVGEETQEWPPWQTRLRPRPPQPWHSRDEWE